MVDRKALLQVAAGVALAAFAVSVLVTNILPTSRTISATEHRLERLESRNARLEDEIRDADHEAERLQSDRWAVERILRDEFRMTEEGERIVR